MIHSSESEKARRYGTFQTLLNGIDGGDSVFYKRNAERSFGDNEIMIDKQSGDAMPFFMAVDQGLLTLDTPIRLGFSTGQPIEAGDADATRT